MWARAACSWAWGRGPTWTIRSRSPSRKPFASTAATRPKSWHGSRRSSGSWKRTAAGRSSSTARPAHRASWNSTTPCFARCWEMVSVDNGPLDRPGDMVMIGSKRPFHPKEVALMNVWFPLIRSQRQARFPDPGLFDRIFAETAASPAGETVQAWTPAIDVSETPAEIVVHAEVPGMDKKDLDLTFSDGLLTIRGEKRAETQTEGSRHLHVERRYGSFSRTVRIPDTVDAGAIGANYKDGLLTVRLPKRSGEKRRRVPIQTAGAGDIIQQD
ncbi:MAG TPA: Hsp20/alpha crystallin family protein [Desulfobacteraceae bacterium]|nr:Hsp20/alpha crystallin family protein [Desulfobacteraceae bacterium]